MKMIVRPKDAVKLLGVLIMTACAALPCTLFLNSNLDMARIKDQITDPDLLALYDAIVTSGWLISSVAGGALLITTVIMLLFYIKHYIDTHKSELGILKALGYSDWKIAKGFWVFGFGVLAGTAAGFGVAFAMMPMFYREMRSDELLPEVPLHFNPELALFLVLLPALAFALLSIVYGLRKLKRPALELITGKGKEKKPKSGRDKDGPFLRELRQSTVRSRGSLVFLIGFSAFCYADMVQMSFGVTEYASEMMSVMMMGIGLALASATLYIAVTTVIKANAKTLAMLRVFGYSDRECGGAILSGYRPTAYIGFAIGTAYQYGLMRMMMAMFAAGGAVDLPEYRFDVQALIITLVSFAVIYEIVMAVYTARIKRVSLKEIMLEG